MTIYLFYARDRSSHPQSQVQESLLKFVNCVGGLVQGRYSGAWRFHGQWRSGHCGVAQGLRLGPNLSGKDRKGRGVAQGLRLDPKFPGKASKGCGVAQGLRLGPKSPGKDRKMNTHQLFFG